MEGQNIYDSMLGRGIKSKWDKWIEENYKIFFYALGFLSGIISVIIFLLIFGG